MFKFAIRDFIKNINFAINIIKIVKINFNKLFIFIIIKSEHNNIILKIIHYL